jgi:hypothetical protein
MRVIIGYDGSEPEAARVAAASLARVTKGELVPEFLLASKLRDQGLLTRLEDTRTGIIGGAPRRYDLVSNAPCSTEFSNSRFLVPIIATGIVLFVDCDVVFLRDPREMDSRPGPAVRVVQHVHQPSSTTKMEGALQTVYPRKNWSSVMLFDCDHPAHRRLSLWDVNNRPGRDLHRFYWLHDEEIGALDPAWNWLLGEQERPERCGIAHFTTGGPFTPGWRGGEWDDLWLEAAKCNL